MYLWFFYHYNLKINWRNTTCTLIFPRLKLDNGLKKHVQNVAETRYWFVKLVVIFFWLFAKYFSRFNGFHCCTNSGRVIAVLLRSLPSIVTHSWECCHNSLGIFYSFMLQLIFRLSQVFSLANLIRILLSLV